MIPTPLVGAKFFYLNTAREKGNLSIYCIQSTYILSKQSNAYISYCGVWDDYKDNELQMVEPTDDWSDFGSYSVLRKYSIFFFLVLLNDFEMSGWAMKVLLSVNKDKINKQLLFWLYLIRKWNKVETLMTITEAVHDVAFAPNLGRSYHTLAVASKDVKINQIPSLFSVR